MSLKMSDVEGLGDNNVTMPVNVYCSLVRCALQNSTLGFQSSLLNPLNRNLNGNLGLNTLGNTHITNFKMDGLNSTINCLMKLSNDEAAGVDSTKMPMPPKANKGNLEGDLKDSLDRLKSELFNHYSFYYNLQEYDIPTRLEMLSVHSIGDGTSHRNSSDHDCGGQHCRGNVKLNGNVMDMLDGLKHKFETINERINLLEQELENEVSDPNIREYYYSSETKKAMGFDDMDDMENMKEHIHNLYSHLYHQSKVNQKKIEVLQKKLLTLTTHTRLVNKRQSNDKRSAL